MAATRYNVRVGQTYADNDPRRTGRKIVVEFITPAPLCRSLHEDSGQLAICRDLGTGKVSPVSVRRFKNTRQGYLLVEDVADDVA